MWYIVIVERLVNNMIGLEEILKIHNCSVAELANELGIARSNIYNWFKSKRKIPSEILDFLSDKYKLPKDYFVRELLDYEKDEIEIELIKKQISENSFEYQDTIINDEGEEEEVTMEYIDQSLVDLQQRYSEHYKIHKLKAEISERVTGIVSEEENVENFALLINKVCDLFESKKVPFHVLRSILSATLIAYEIQDISKSDDFENKLIAVIKENEDKRQIKMKEFEELSKKLEASAKEIEELFG